MKAREAIDGIGRILLDRVQEGLTGTLLIRVEYSQGGIRSVKAASEPEYDEVWIVDDYVSGGWDMAGKSL